MSSAITRRAAFEWAHVALLGSNLVWTTLCLGGYRPGTAAVTTLLTAGLMLLHGLALVLGCNGGTQTRLGVHPAAWLLVPFLGYGLVNVLWVTPVPWLGWMDWWAWVQAWVVFAVVSSTVVSDRARTTLLGLLVALAVGSVVLEAYQVFVRPGWLMLGRLQVEQYVGRASGPFGIPNSMAALLLLVLPVVFGLLLRRGASAVSRVLLGWMAAVLLLGLGLTISRGAWIGFAVALVAWPLVHGGRSWRKQVVRAAVVAFAVTGAVVAGFVASPRVQERITQFVQEAGERSRPVLWRAALKLARDEPWLGTGAGSFNGAFERHRPEGFLNEPIWAHNEYLNTLSDYGAVGFVLLFGAVGLIVWRNVVRGSRAAGESSANGAAITKWRTTSAPPRPLHPLGHPLVREGLGIGLLAFALQLFVDFHFKIPALAMSCAMVAALALRRDHDVPADQTRSRGAVGVVGTAFIAGAVAAFGLIVPQYRAEAWREMARERIDALAEVEPETPAFRAGVLAARAEVDRAVALNPRNARAWADRSYAAAQASLFEPSRAGELGRGAEADANRALAECNTVAEFWIRRGVARDLQGRYDEAGEDFARALGLAPMTPLPWFHYAHHLSLRPARVDMAEAMLTTCLRLDPQNRDAHRLRHQLAAGRVRP